MYSRQLDFNTTNRYKVPYFDYMINMTEYEGCLFESFVFFDNRDGLLPSLLFNSDLYVTELEALESSINFIKSKIIQESENAGNRS